MTIPTEPTETVLKAIEADTTKIEPLGLSPLTFDLVTYKERTLRIEPPLALSPDLEEESKQLLVMENDELTLHACASTREILEDEIKQQLFLLWDEYAQE